MSNNAAFPSLLGVIREFFFLHDSQWLRVKAAQMDFVLVADSVLNTLSLLPKALL